MASDILRKLQEEQDRFSKGQKRLAAYILESYDKAAFLTAGKLGKTVGVSESTVVRFAAELGYEGYPGMQKDLQEILRNKLTAVQRMSTIHEHMSGQELVAAMLQTDMETLRQTDAALDRESLHRAVGRILAARTVYLVGVRSSATLVSFLNYYLRNMMDNVHLVAPGDVCEMFEQLVRVGPEDVVVAASFPRYSTCTIKTLQFCRNSGAGLVAITDSPQAPVARLAHHVLLAKSERVSFVDSLVAPLSVINALIVSIGRAMETDLSKIYGELEHIWEEYEVYERIEN